MHSAILYGYSKRTALRFLYVPLDGFTLVNILKPSPKYRNDFFHGYGPSVTGILINYVDTIHTQNQKQVEQSRRLNSQMLGNCEKINFNQFEFESKGHKQFDSTSITKIESKSEYTKRLDAEINYRDNKWQKFDLANK